MPVAPVPPLKVMGLKSSLMVPVVPGGSTARNPNCPTPSTVARMAPGAVCVTGPVVAVKGTCVAPAGTVTVAGTVIGSGERRDLPNVNAVE